MNYSSCLVVLLLFLTSCLVSESEAVNCYVCFTGCSDPFDSSGVRTTECAFSCSKAKSSQVVVRTCSPAKLDNTCVSVDVNGETAESCFCNSDLCNAGSVQKVSVGMALMMSLLKFIY